MRLVVVEPAVRLVYERTSPPGEDSGVEPLIAVCATEAEAEHIVTEAKAVRGRYASFERHLLRDTTDRTTPVVEGAVVHVVLLGGGDAGPEDPIGIAVYADREPAQQRAVHERDQTGSPGYHVISLPIGWRGWICGSQTSR